MPTERALLGVLVLCGLLVAEGAHAYCRTNTCDADPDDPNCHESAEGCLEGGAALFWDRSCLSFSVHEAGSVKRGVSYGEAASTIAASMNQWTVVECPGGGSPAMAVELSPPVTCEEIEYNRRGPNANTWLFRDEVWPYDASGNAALTLALTTVTFNARTGEILDADVEVNSADNLLTADDESEIAAVATHEAGHVFGLAHSSESGATMWAYYSAQMASTPELGADDVAGICAAYPPGSEAETCDFDPEGGFTARCYEAEDSGCAVRTGGAGTGFRGIAVFAAVAALATWARRRRH